MNGSVSMRATGRGSVLLTRGVAVWHSIKSNTVALAVGGKGVGNILNPKRSTSRSIRLGVESRKPGRRLQGGICEPCYGRPR